MTILVLNFLFQAKAYRLLFQLRYKHSSFMASLSQRHTAQLSNLTMKQTIKHVYRAAKLVRLISLPVETARNVNNLA